MYASALWLPVKWLRGQVEGERPAVESGWIPGPKSSIHGYTRP